MKQNYFVMNGIEWLIEEVEPDDQMLVDRTGIQTVATTDPRTRTVYISNRLRGDFLKRVLIHELGHCAMISFDLLGLIHEAVRPAYWIEAEEWLCNYIADYGLVICEKYSEIVGNAAWLLVPHELERLIG